MTPKDNKKNSNKQRLVKTITINGKRKYFYGKSKAEINKKIINYKEKEEEGLLFSEVSKSWNDEYQKNSSIVTYKKCVKAAYERNLERFKDSYIKDIMPSDIDSYIKFLAKKGFAQKTVSNHKSLLNQVFSYAIINGDVKINPVRDIPLPKNLPKKERQMASTEDIKKIDEAYNIGEFGFLAYFLLYTGLRKSEALALTYGDIDKEKKMINVNKKIVFDGNQPILEDKTKTRAGLREVVLLDRLADKIPNKAKSKLLFEHEGGYFTHSKLIKGWGKLQKTLEITATAHQLRHAYATMLFEAGIDEKDAQELMGHSDINLTRSIYTTLEEREKKEQQIN